MVRTSRRALAPLLLACACAEGRAPLPEDALAEAFGQGRQAVGAPFQLAAGRVRSGPYSMGPRVVFTGSDDGVRSSDGSAGSVVSLGVSGPLVPAGATAFVDGAIWARTDGTLAGTSALTMAPFYGQGATQVAGSVGYRIVVASGSSYCLRTSNPPGDSVACDMYLGRLFVGAFGAGATGVFWIQESWVSHDLQYPQRHRMAFARPGQPLLYSSSYLTVATYGQTLTFRIAGDTAFFTVDGGASALLGGATTVPIPTAPDYSWALTGAAGLVLFSAGGELWRADLSTVARVRDIHPSGSSSPAGLGKLGARFLLSADDGVHGREPWVSDGTSEGTRLLADIAPGPASSSPGAAQECMGRLLFNADDGVRGPRLWTTDGTPDGTARLGEISGTVLGSGIGGCLLAARDATHGLEPWLSRDGYSAPFLLADLNPNGDSAPEQFLLGPETGAADRIGYFVASACAAGAPRCPPVLCQTDGYAGATTRPVEAVPSAESPRSLAFAGTNLVFAGRDPGGDVATEALWSLPLGPGGPVIPRLTCPAATAEATSASGAAAAYPAASHSGFSGTVTVSYSIPSGSTFALGTTAVTGTATDGAGHSATCSFSVTVRDTTQPALACPADISREATDAAGAVVSFTVSATDAVSTPTISATPASGTKFPVGTNTVNATATDSAGNTGTCSFRVIVTQTSTPSIACPPDATMEATGPNGAIVTYGVVQTSGFSGTPNLQFSVPDGSRFGLGTATVSVQATYGAQSASCTFRVAVRDTTAPAITCPADLRAEATGPSGAAVAFAVQATDAVSAPTKTLSHASGSTFASGRTTVSATARDNAGNTASCAFAVIVSDTTAPLLTCPADMTLEATGADGAFAAFTVPASDVVSTPTVTTSPASGARFSLGSTTVTATARDAANNASTCTFRVLVRDTAAPTILCPDHLVREATGPGGASVSFEIRATDAVGVASVTADRAPNSQFPLGDTTVAAVARDAAGNQSSCSFQVSVRDTTPPSITCPADRTLEATGPGGAALGFSATATDAVSSASVTYDRAPGTVFPLGETTVTATATDAAGNSRNCQFTVTVRDTTAPALACPEDVIAEATSLDGAIVTYELTATDAVSTPVVAGDPASGAAFPLGDTVVHVSASDSSGNASACSFVVTVRDTTPPAVTCPADMLVEATGPQGAPVDFQADATDAASIPVITSFPRARDVFPLGETDVTVTAQDGAGNHANCQFTVTVRDTTAPTLSCPEEVQVSADNEQRVRLEELQVRAGDAVSAVQLALASADSTARPHGESLLTVTATDAAGNAAQCTVTMIVAPGALGGCATSDVAGVLPLALALLGAVRRMRLRAAATGSH